MIEKSPFVDNTIKEGLNRLVAYGLLKYDSEQDTYIDSNFSKELTEIKHRTAITRLINRVEKYVRNQTLAQVEKIIDKYFEIDCECDTDYTLGRIRKEVKNLKEKHE